ncbi:hypothetical protein [Anaerococcus ihuae]|nr:hypothetical protein [Anaerococcus ihuae]
MRNKIKDKKINGNISPIFMARFLYLEVELGVGIMYILILKKINH